MSVIRYVTVTCDKCFAEYDHGSPFLLETRRDARSDGWISSAREDVCPDCRGEEP
jgi:hypothetical protein